MILWLPPTLQQTLSALGFAIRALAEIGQQSLESADYGGLLADAAVSRACVGRDEETVSSATAPTDAEIGVDSLSRVDDDPGRLRQLLRNLLDTPIPYSGDGTPRISVFAENNGATWIISVRDRGIGIDPADADRIFQVFDRLHSREEYADIGLALCQRIVECRDGEITVDSEPGEGTTFSVALPTVPETGSVPPLETTGATDANTELSTDE